MSTCQGCAGSGTIPAVLPPRSQAPPTSVNTVAGPGDMTGWCSSAHRVAGDKQHADAAHRDRPACVRSGRSEVVFCSQRSARITAQEKHVEYTTCFRETTSIDASRGAVPLFAHWEQGTCVAHTFWSGRRIVRAQHGRATQTEEPHPAPRRKMHLLTNSCVLSPLCPETILTHVPTSQTALANCESGRNASCKNGATRMQGSACMAPKNRNLWACPVVKQSFAVVRCPDWPGRRPESVHAPGCGFLPI